MTQLTRRSTKSIIPKLLNWEEKERARQELEVKMEEFFANDGFIREIPQGESGNKYYKWSIK
jgi:hypothetical protein|tara:strand:+ start:136 stop:321 length:186 start_codon:yes stop_codon:yes gene_type:complete